MKAKRTDNKEINDFVSIEERILQLVREASETDWENNRWVILGYPSPKEVKTLNALLGCDVTGFQRMIDFRNLWALAPSRTSSSRRCGDILEFQI